MNSPTRNLACNIHGIENYVKSPARNPGFVNGTEISKSPARDPDYTNDTENLDSQTINPDYVSENPNPPGYIRRITP